MNMVTLNIFNSIYFFIAFVIAAAFMLTMTIKAMGKDNDEPRNKVRFFVVREVPEIYFLFIRHKDGMWYICSDYHFKLFGLNTDDFADMKVGEIREVFINLEE